MVSIVVSIEFFLMSKEVPGGVLSKEENNLACMLTQHKCQIEMVKISPKCGNFPKSGNTHAETVTCAEAELFPHFQIFQY